MSTFIPPTPAANKSAEQHEEPSEQDSFNHLLFKVLWLTSEQVQDLNDWMKHQGIPNVHEVIAQNFRKPHALEDDLQLIREDKPCYIQSNVMISLSLMITYIKHLRYSAKTKYFGPFYYIQIDPQDYDEWRTTPPEEEVHFQTPSKLGSPATPRSMATSVASESYITLTNFKKGVKRDASAYPIFKNERYYNTFIRHFKATAKAQGLNSLMDPNFTPGSDEYEQQLFQDQQDFLYSVLISSLKTDFSEALLKDHEGDAQLIIELLHEHHTGNSQYSRSEINRITKYLTNIKLDDTWRGTNESFLMHYNDQLFLLDSLVDSDEKLPDNTRVTFLESAVESVPDLRRVKITDNVLQAQLDSTRPITYRSYFDLLKDAAFHLDQATKRGSKIRRTNVHFSGPNNEDDHQNLLSDDHQVIQQEDVCSEPPEPLSYSVFQSHFQGSSTSSTQKIFLPKPIWEKLSKDQQQMIIDHNRSLPKSGSSSISTPDKSPSPLPHKPTPQQTAKSQQVHTHQSDESTADTTKIETTPSDPLLAMVHQSIHTSDDDASDITKVLSAKRSRQIQVCKHYIFQHANHTNNQLVDHGANGGLAGSDMRVIYKTHRKINISGIDNHEVNGLDVVTAATLLNTTLGKVIGIFNEYAHLGKGSSIHSSGQLEWFKTHVDENALILGQCSKTIRDRIEAHEHWDTVNTSSNALGLLRLIRQSLYQRATRRQETHALIEAETALMRFRQSEQMSNSDYLEKLRDLVEVYEHLGGEPGTSKARIDGLLIDPEFADEDDKQEAKSKAREEYLAVLLLTKSDPKRYGTLVTDVENAYTRGQNGYPTTVSGAYDMLVNYRNPNQALRMQNQDMGIAFAQDSQDGDDITEPSQQYGRQQQDYGRAGRGRHGGRDGGRGHGRNGRGGRTGASYAVEQQDDNSQNIQDENNLGQAVGPYIMEHTHIGIETVLASFIHHLPNT